MTELKITLLGHSCSFIICSCGDSENEVALAILSLKMLKRVGFFEILGGSLFFLESEWQSLQHGT